MVVPIAVCGRFDGEFEGLRYLEDWGPGRFSGSVQQIDDVGAADDLLFERGGAGITDRFQTIERDHQQDVHELAIAIAMFGQALSQSCHGGRQVPVLERCAVA